MNSIAETKLFSRASKVTVIQEIEAKLTELQKPNSEEISISLGNVISSPDCESFFWSSVSPWLKKKYFKHYTKIVEFIVNFSPPKKIVFQSSLSIGSLSIRSVPGHVLRARNPGRGRASQKDPSHSPVHEGFPTENVK